jgi:hypothetical protein
MDAALLTPPSKDAFTGIATRSSLLSEDDLEMEPCASYCVLELGSESSAGAGYFITRSLLRLWIVCCWASKKVGSGAAYGRPL